MRDKLLASTSVARSHGGAADTRGNARRGHDSPEPGAAANARTGRANRDAELAPVAAN
jgi:hypothetical protein